jgi:hypothetical protein
MQSVQEASGKEWQSEMALVRFLFICQYKSRQDIAYLLASLSLCAAWVHLLRANTNTNLPQSKTGMLRIRLGRVGNFIKPIPAIPFIGPQPQAPAFEKPEKSWRGYNRCMRHWRGAARHICWSPVCILRWTLHSRPRNYIDGLEIGTPYTSAYLARTDNFSVINHPMT